MKVGFPIMVLLLIVNTAFAQHEDSTVVEAYYDSTGYDDYAYDTDSIYAGTQYTQRPGELNTVKEEQKKHYTEKKFSKTAWKEIVGETNYTEEQIAEKKKEAQTKKFRGNSAPWNPALVKITGYLLIIALILVILFFLVKSTLADTTTVKSNNDFEALLQENQHIEDINEADIDRLLKEALQRNDFRAAIRLYYIRLLKHLHATNHITWKRDKTNRDYASELASCSFIREFKKLMTAYEITWYGERTPSADEFKRLESGFTSLHGQTSHRA